MEKPVNLLLFQFVVRNPDLCLGGIIATQLGSLSRVLVLAIDVANIGAIDISPPFLVGYILR